MNKKISESKNKPWHRHKVQVIFKMKNENRDENKDEIEIEILIE